MGLWVDPLTIPFAHQPINPFTHSLPSIRLREQRAAGGGLAGEEALAGLGGLIERDATDRDFEFLENLVHLWPVDKRARRQSAVEFCRSG